MPQFPAELRTDFYMLGQVNSVPFSSGTWKMPAKATADQTSDWFRHAFQTYSALGVAGVDLGLPLEQVREFFADAARTYYQHMVAQPLRGQPREVIDAFFGFAICRDGKGAARFAEAFSRSVASTSKGKDCESPGYWALANVLVAQAMGSPALAVAAKTLKTAPPPKEWGLKSVGTFEALRKLALHCATAEKPDPVELLLNVATAQAKEWKFHDTSSFDGYVARRALTFAALARDRGWKVPKADPHPSLPLALLSLKPKRVDLDDTSLAAPAAALKKQVKKAEKDAYKAYFAAKKK